MSAGVNIFFSHLEMFNSLLLGFVSRGTFQVKFKNVSIKKFPKAAFCGEEKWLYKVSEISFLPKLSGIFEEFRSAAICFFDDIMED